MAQAAGQILTQGDICQGVARDGCSHSKAQDHVEVKGGHKRRGQADDGEEQQLDQNAGFATNPMAQRGQVRGESWRGGEGRGERETQPCPGLSVYGGYTVPP